MKILKSSAIAATLVVATIVASFILTSCQGRRMSNMTPTGDTVEVVVNQQEVIELQSAHQ